MNMYSFLLFIFEIKCSNSPDKYIFLNSDAILLLICKDIVRLLSTGYVRDDL